MPKLTADLIQSAESVLNPIGDRELILRGFRIPTIENLGVTRNLNDMINLNDNELSQIENIPYLPRLKSLMLCNNQIRSIDPTVHSSIPNLHTLILTNNQFSQLSDIDVYFVQFRDELTHLSLAGNPITNCSNYRLFVIFRLPKLRCLDFHRVLDKERAAAKELFTSDAGLLLIQDMSLSQNAFLSHSASPATNSTTMKPKMSKEELNDIKEQLMKATSMHEIQRLEELLH